MCLRHLRKLIPALTPSWKNTMRANMVLTLSYANSKVTKETDTVNKGTENLKNEALDSLTYLKRLLTFESESFQ